MDKGETWNPLYQLLKKVEQKGVTVEQKGVKVEQKCVKVEQKCVTVDKVDLFPCLRIINI